MAPGVVLIDRLWAEPEHQRAGAAVAALGLSTAEALRRYRHIPGSGCVWITDASNRAMMAFNARRLAPYATSVARQVESAKTLGSARG